MGNTRGKVWGTTLVDRCNPVSYHPEVSLEFDMGARCILVDPIGSRSVLAEFALTALKRLNGTLLKAGKKAYPP